MRLVIISNRLPVTAVTDNGKIEFSPSIGGLATGLMAFLKGHNGSLITDFLWVGWPGVSVKAGQEDVLTKELLEKFKCYPVFLTQAMYAQFYIDFCNNCLWPLFHSMPTLVDENGSWHAYETTNQLYFDAIKEVVRADDIVWINDYHLMLLPELIRKAFSGISICFFLHIPFPSYEIFRILSNAWKERILKGILSSDLIGFHTNDYLQEFLKSVIKILGFEHKNGKIFIDNRIVKVDSYPMGIDFKSFDNVFNNQEMVDKCEKFKIQLGNQKLILSIDRLDYTKGILNRLKAYEQFLSDYPEWHKNISLMLIIAPSRIDVSSYKRMKEQIDEQVGKINGYFSMGQWLPIIYQYKSKTLEELAVLYRSADIALITPLRDGMNLIAKEFVASRADEKGVLILSELAGASIELSDATLVNPYHIHEIKLAILESLTLHEDEQRLRLRNMRKRIREYDVIRWSEDLLKDTLQTREENTLLLRKEFNSDSMGNFSLSFTKAKQRLILIDYDGTLVPFEKFPKLAVPSEVLLAMLNELASQPAVKLVILTGRDRQTVDSWFAGIQADFVAEHGVMIKSGDCWNITGSLQSEWKQIILPFLQNYVLKLPGSFIEEKEFSLVWHFRNSEIDASNLRQQGLIENLTSLLEDMSLELTLGVKSIEIKKKGVSKRNGLASILNSTYDFIACFGDDYSDEELYNFLPSTAFTFKVGYEPTNAMFILRDCGEVYKTLKNLVPNQPGTIELKSKQ